MAALHKSTVSKPVNKRFSEHLNGGGFLSPPLRRGRCAVQEKWNATLETAQRGEVKHVLKRCLTSLKAARCRPCAARRVAPKSRGSVTLFDSARQPLLRGGDKNPLVFKSISSPRGSIQQINFSR
jgi:hypothetical protein